MPILFCLSIFFWIANRIYSAVKIWEISSLEGVKFVEKQADDFREKAEKARKWRVIWTLCDLEVFEILHLSHTLGLNGKSTPQRLLDLISAVFESAPEVQSLFQCVNIFTFCITVSVCILSRRL